MPNWCECDLVVSGPSAEVCRFKQDVKCTDEHGKTVSVLSADKITPYPEHFRKQDDAMIEYQRKLNEAIGRLKDEEREKAFEEFVKQHGECPTDGFNSGGYEWCIENWGTKSGIVDAEIIGTFDAIKNDYSEVAYTFRCAWIPPEPLVRKMGRLYPELYFDLRYFESGCCFNGLIVIYGGEVVEDESGLYFGDRGG